MNGKTAARIISIFTVIACVLALIAGVTGFSSGMTEVSAKKEEHGKLTARLDGLKGTLDTLDAQKSDYDALLAGYDAAQLEYQEQLDAHESTVKDYESSVLGYNQGLLGDAGLEQLTQALSLSSSFAVNWDREQLSRSRTAYENGLKKYEEAKAVYDEARAQFEAGRNAYYAGQQQINAAKQQLADGQKQYDAALKAYQAGETIFGQVMQGKELYEKYDPLHRLIVSTPFGEYGQQLTDQFFDDRQADMSAAKAKLDEIQAQMDQAKYVISSGESQLAAAAGQIREGEAQLNQLKDNLDKGKTELAAAKELLEEKEKSSPQSALDPQDADPGDSELMKALAKLSSLEHISEIDAKLMDTPEGLEQVSKLISGNELVLSNYKIGLEDAKKELDNYEALKDTVSRGREQLINDGFGTDADSARTLLDEAYAEADHQKADYTGQELLSTAALILLIISAILAIFSLRCLSKNRRRARIFALSAVGAAAIGIFISTFAGAFSLIGLLTTVLLACSSAIMFFRDAETE